MNTTISTGGHSAYPMAFGSKPADLFGRADNDERMLFSKDTSLSGQFVQQWKLRKRQQEAAPREAANSKLRSLLPYNKSFNCADVAVGGSFLCYEAQSRESSPRWRGPARILDIDDTGATAIFQSQTLMVDRH